MRLLIQRQWRHPRRGICLIIATRSDLHNQFLTLLCCFFLLMGEGIPGKPSDSSEILERLGDGERTGIHLPQCPSLGLCIFFVNAYFSPELFVEWHLHGIKSFCFHALLSYNWQVQIVHVQGVHWLDTGTHCSDCYNQINGQSSTTHIYSCVCMPRWGHLRVTVFANSI